jgi:hypothetical protein
MFVFDVSNTVPNDDARPLPPEVLNPFEPTGGSVSIAKLNQTIENAKRDGINVCHQDAGSQSAGRIRRTVSDKTLEVVVRRKFPVKSVRVPVLYELFLNANHSREAKYATLVHELAHLYCGHLGTLHPKWWPDRRQTDVAIREFEAESVCYLVCQRLGIQNPSPNTSAGT